MANNLRENSFSPERIEEDLIIGKHMISQSVAITTTGTAGVLSLQAISSCKSILAAIITSAILTILVFLTWQYLLTKPIPLKNENINKKYLSVFPSQWWSTYIAAGWNLTFLILFGVTKAYLCRP